MIHAFRRRGCVHTKCRCIGPLDSEMAGAGEARVSRSLEMQHMPTSRHTYPNGPFEKMTTKEKRDADPAYNLHRDPMKGKDAR